MKVHIVGKGSGWEDAPFEGEVWGITQLNLKRPVSKVIDMNDYSLWGRIEAEDAKKSRQLAMESGIEYIDRDTYPFEEIVKWTGTDYFTSTVDFAIAYALYDGFRHIHLWGCNMAHGSEYAYQKPGCEFWCGYALGIGSVVTIHGELSSIMKTRNNTVYGYGFKQKERSEMKGDLRHAG